eukprot:scpid73266/ scgid2287/ 
MPQLKNLVRPGSMESCFTEMGQTRCSHSTTPWWSSDGIFYSRGKNQPPLLSDAVETYSHSNELMKILAKLGIVAGRDTFDRYKMAMVDQHMSAGVQKDMMLHTFSLAY